MSRNISDDERSEDGELHQSPINNSRSKIESMMMYHHSDEEDEAADMDSLDIKPPQAKVSETRIKKKPSEKHHYRSSSGGGGGGDGGRSSDKKRDERHSHRDKHHRDKSRSSQRDKELYQQRERDRYYREKQQPYEQLGYNEQQYMNERAFRERKAEEARERHEKKYYDEKSKGVRNHSKDSHEKYKRDRQYEEEKRDRANKALADLRERLTSELGLIEKRKSEDGQKYEKRRYNNKERNNKYREENVDDPLLEGESGNYVKEILTIQTSAEDRKQIIKKDNKDFIIEKHLTDDDDGDDDDDDEKYEQEQRREKLLEAEREMARLKERSKAERERRRHHFAKVAKRKQQDAEQQQGFQKKFKLNDLQQQVVTVSDVSDDDDDQQQQQNEENDEEITDDSNKSEENEENDEETSDRSVGSPNSPPSRSSRSPSRSRSRNRSKSTSPEENSYSDKSRRSRTKSKSRSVSRSPTRSRSQSSEKSDGSRSKSKSPSSAIIIEEDEMLKNNKNNDNKKTAAADLEELVEIIKDENNGLEDEDDDDDEDLPPYYPALQGCRSVEEFQCLNRIEEGTYGVVYRARDKRTDEIVALKRLKMENEKEGFPITSLREINTLLKGQHSNIVTVREIVVGSNMDKIFIVMDYVEHDLKSLMETMRHKKQRFMPGEIKCLLKQLLYAVAHLHDNWILHRDLKTSNLLLSHKGILKVGDFGLAREYGSPLKAYTSVVVTLWYRAPELLLCSKEYSTPIDIWSVGCIFAELLLMNAVFPGKTEVGQLNRIFKDLGTPSEKIWTGFNELPAVKKMKFNEYPVSNLRAKFNNLSEIGLGLLLKFLTYDPAQRITAEEALKHAYFTEPPLPIDPAMFPTWPAKSELGHKRAMAASPKPPSGGGEYKKLVGEDDDGYGFRLGMGIDMRRGGAGFSLKF